MSTFGKLVKAEKDYKSIHFERRCTRSNGKLNLSLLSVVCAEHKKWTIFRLSRTNILSSPDEEWSIHCTWHSKSMQSRIINSMCHESCWVAILGWKCVDGMRREKKQSFAFQLLNKFCLHFEVNRLNEFLLFER